MDAIVKKHNLKPTGFWTGAAFINNVRTYSLDDEYFITDGRPDGEPYPKRDKVTVWPKNFRGCCQVSKALLENTSTHELKTILASCIPCDYIV